MDRASEALRGDLWRDAMAERFSGLRCASDRVQGAVHSLALDQIMFHQIQGNAQALQRTGADSRREPSDWLKVCLMRHGRAMVEQNGVTVTIGPGEFALYDTSRPYRVSFEASWEVSVLTVPRDGLGLTERRLGRLMQQPIDVRSGPGHIFASYLLGLTRVDSVQPATVVSLGTAGLSLLAGALTENLEVVSGNAPEMLAAELIRFVEANLADPRLGLELVAGEHHLAPRTVQRALAGEGLTLRGLIRDRRLDAIRRDLLDASLAHQTVAVIAARWGVLDQPWLSRTFKAAFGETPTQYRHRHGR